MQFCTCGEQQWVFNQWGYRNFARHSGLLSSLIDGTLVIEVLMKLILLTDSVPPPFIPENPSQRAS
jgi:uncharacterized metal-binding protein